MLGTAGHVDHGKTALVRLLTGCETDRLADEKKRGLTIELGFAPCRMADERIVGIVDVPGHVDFIRNMVAGSHGVDVVILVVAADDGVMPQTREHLDILTLMGVRDGLVVLTKTDLVDAETCELVAEEIRDFARGTFLEDAPVCPVSNVTAEGFDGFFEALNEVTSRCRPRPIDGLFRLWIERVFSIPGVGTVCSGIPDSGEVSVGEHLAVLPGERTCRVRGMEVYGERSDMGRADECLALDVTDVPVEELGRGMVLCAPGAFSAVTMCEAELRMLDVPRELKDHAEVHLHVGTDEVMANVAMLRSRPPAPGGSDFVQLRMSRPLAVAPGERFVIRSSMAGLAGGRLTTIGGGRILSTSNLRLRRKRPWTLESLAARREAIDSTVEWVGLHLREAGKPLKADELATKAQRRLPAVNEALQELGEQARAVRTESGWVHSDTIAAAAEAIEAELAEFHDANTRRLGLALSELSAASDFGRDVLTPALERLASDGRIVRHGSVVALPGRGAQLGEVDRNLYERIEQRLASAGLEPPRPPELAEELSEPPERIEAMLDVLSDAGRVVRLDRKVTMHADAVAEAREVVLELFAAAGVFETVRFRDALGVSRKYAVPLLDYFDTVRLTVRSGSRRTPGAEARRLLMERKPE